MARRLLAVLIGLVPLAWAVPVAAADTGWTVDSFSGDFTVQKDGAVKITETIDVNFASVSRHGIYRDIPVRYAYSDKYDRSLDLSSISVVDGSGHSIPFTTSMHGADEELKIGDANRTVTGRQAYVIRYTVRGAFNGFSDHDELYWNLTGNAWPVPIARASASVHAPEGSVERVACFQGAPGSTDPCASATASGSSGALFQATRALEPGEGLTFVTALSKGTVPEPKPILVRRPRTLLEMFELSVTDLVGAGLVLGAGLAGLAWLYWRSGRDRAYRTAYYLNHDPATPDEIQPLGDHRPVVVEFGPPDNYRPAQLGLILDERADTRDMTASLVDLAARGYLTITELKGEGIFGRHDYQLTQVVPAPDVTHLQEFERTLYYGLFPANRSQVKLSELKGTFHDTLDSARGQLLRDAMARRWFTHRPDLVAIGWRVAGIATVVLGGVIAFVLGQATGDGLVGVALAVVGVAVTLLAGAMPARTATGHDMLYRTLGFRLYMTTAERYQQQFAEREKIFTTLLPFAIVFGCVDAWANAFRDIDLQRAVSGWYTGGAYFNALAFSSSLQGFASTVDTSLASVPASSGSSGFGGGSGGGFGGGGGGSW